MTFTVHDRRPIPEIETTIERLRQLTLDLERIRRGEHPGRRTLASAPTLENWGLVRRAEYCLGGTVYGHPSIKDGRPAVTSALWVLAPTLGYARTLSRFYAIGKSRNATEILR